MQVLSNAVTNSAENAVAIKDCGPFTEGRMGTISMSLLTFLKPAVILIG